MLTIFVSANNHRPILFFRGKINLMLYRVSYDRKIGPFLMTILIYEDFKVKPMVYEIIFLLSHERFWNPECWFIAMTYCQLTVPVCTCCRSKLFLSYSIFKLVLFFPTRSICLNLDQFGTGKKHAGHKSITAHCLPIQEVS